LVFSALLFSLFLIQYFDRTIKVSQEIFIFFSSEIFIYKKKKNLIKREVKNLN